MPNLGYSGLDKHVFEKINFDQLLSLINSKNAVPVFFAFSSCVWCQEYISYLNNCAIDFDVEKIYYFNPKEIRTYFFDKDLGKVVLNEYFSKLLDTIGIENVATKAYCDIDNLDDLCDNKEVFSWLYVPILYIFQEGKVLGSYNGPKTHEKVNGFLRKLNNSEKEELVGNYNALLSLL